MGQLKLFVFGLYIGCSFQALRESVGCYSKPAASSSISVGSQKVGQKEREKAEQKCAKPKQSLITNHRGR